jgi:hypothetical protein
MILFTSIQAQQIPTIDIQVKIKGDYVLNTISDHFFGHNYWLWCPSWGNKIEGTAPQIAELKVKLLRFGGIAADLEYPDPVTNGVISGFNSYCKKIGAEPMFQVPLARFTTINAKKSNALAMTKYFKKIRDLTYVSVGNEPDIYATNLAANVDYKADYLSEYKLENYCEDFNGVASELKKNYPDLKIIGLELGYNYDVWIPGFIANCKDNIDMLSVHYYAFPPGQCLYSKASNQFNELNDFYSRIRTHITQNAGGKDIPLIIGETNITYDGEPRNSNHDASPGTFAAALWFADFIGVSSTQKNLFSVMPWSIREDWFLGFMTAQKRPVFYVYQMFSNFYKTQCIHVENIDNKVRIYGYKDSLDNVSILAVNWDTTSSYSTNFSFVGILNESEYKCTLPPFSLSCITLSSDMKSKKQYVYTKRLEQQGPIQETDKRFKSQFLQKKKGWVRVKAL